MKINKLSKAIEEAIRDVEIFGSSKVRIGNDTLIEGEWEAMEGNSNCAIVSIYILKDGIVKFKYQDESTKVLL